MDKYDMKYQKLIFMRKQAACLWRASLLKDLAVQPWIRSLRNWKQNMVVDSVFINGTKPNFVQTATSYR